ncbi:MAG TPA: cytochrome c biogenesis protein CcsA [Verrucomicrobiae bacterium]|jgi:ABC-type transport system involved in cytochrome c biogenesis permease subunit
MKKYSQRWIPPLLAFIMALWFFAQLRTPKDKDFAFNEFGQLPVVADGRLKPMDSLARNSLLQIYERQTFNTEPWEDGSQKPKVISATEWLANVMMNPQVADTWPVFRVDNPDLITFLKLPEKNLDAHQDGEHYSWDQVSPQLSAFDAEYARVDKEEPSERSAYERDVIKVHDRMELYAQLKNAVQPEDASDWKSELINYLNLIPSGVAAVQSQQAGKKYDEKTFNDFANELQRFNFMAQTEPPLVIPPEKAGDNWQRTGDVLINAAKGDDIPTAVANYAAMTEGLAATNAAAFNSALADYRHSLVPNFQPVLARMRAEVFFNNMQPFYHAMVIYVLAGLLAIFSWFNLSETLRRSAVWLVGLAFFIHTTGLVYRIILSGRPPVTNLYSSAIFIGWGAVILGLILEKFHKNGIGVCVSAGMGFITLIIAQNLSLDGDTMEMMRAVLDTNFWLATHVVAVTTGYASTFVAGFLALIYITRGVFTKTLDAETGKSLARMVYAIVCFATLFSFVGTVLGGIWADQSWGRFWGWDPKENGALIIVLWNALILHLRWGGMIRERGLMCCAIFGNVVTSWSWFGVNMLGIGLHSYGFTEAAFKWLVLFILSQLFFIALGLLPRKTWKSFVVQP